MPPPPSTHCAHSSPTSSMRNKPTRPSGAGERVFDGLPAGGGPKPSAAMTVTTNRAATPATRGAGAGRGKTPERGTPTGLGDLPPTAIIVANDLPPADTALLDPKHVAGIATMLGGVESHT